ncbi:preprotein translocase subunit SecY [Natrinema versiforme JCM 10478]|uniref:Preprotein translocase subunit SecY n=1 Tax=Natrinema versiforme JCM 10478 TaxID=1227496 RepID=L9Y254_9EURY|nr:preprotein translocase subunit SecY [Natrinema versiforme JCM 10478]
MVILTGLPMVFAGGFLPAQQSLQLGGFALDQTGVQLLMFAQIFVGGVLILYMDEVVSKWGVGSGIGLFIIAGVSQRLVTGLVQPSQGGFFFDWYRILTGQVEVGSLISTSGLQTLLINEGHIIALLTTVLIFGIVVYAESVRVEIPLSHARVKGARGRFPVKLIYASVLPMILVRAVQANVQFMGQIMNSQWAGMPSWLGTYSQQGQPTGGFFYYVAPIYSPDDWMWFSANVAQEWWQVMIRIGIDVTFMVVGGAIFAIFWVETTDMGPESTAKQIQNSGMQIPGFRQNVGVIEKVMERYIPQVTVIGGALVGLLAVWANMLGTIGGVSGTGLLLAVSITYKLYEEIAEEQMMEMHPMMRQMFGGGE